MTKNSQKIKKTFLWILTQVAALTVKKGQKWGEFGG
jgi:hypothetical protein